MAYGSALVDNIQSSTANTPVVFKDGNGTQIGTLCRAWVDFGSTGTIVGSFNVSSVTRNSSGNFTVAFTTALPDANYSIVSSIGMNSLTTPYGTQYVPSSKSASSCVVYQFGFDPDQFSVSVFR